MNTYIILFRGINVGGKNIISMKVLKNLLEDEGYENVRTYIQSGNVVLKTKSNPLKQISLLIESKFGLNIESCLGVSATGRNLNTVLKLKEMLQNIK